MYFQDGGVAIVLVIADIVGAMLVATDIGLGETKVYLSTCKQHA